MLQDDTPGRLGVSAAGLAAAAARLKRVSNAPTPPSSPPAPPRVWPLPISHAALCLSLARKSGQSARPLHNLIFPSLRLCLAASTPSLWETVERCSRPSLLTLCSLSWDDSLVFKNWPDSSRFCFAHFQGDRAESGVCISRWRRKQRRRRRRLQRLPRGMSGEPC